jgi:NADPH:quinone reductase-like Zn-dependent oxidoreductase
MKAFAIEELGKPGSVQEMAVPEPGEGQVRIKVAAAGVNPFDNAVIAGYMKDRMEHRFPLIPGADASGTVEALGEGVDSLKIGDEVFGSVGKMYLGEGTVAEFATMSTATITRKPAFIDHALAAAIPVAGVTAQTLVDALKLADGQVVVAIGASGGVGSYFIQLAAARGAHVVAVCSSENVDYVRALGAAEVIDYAAGDVADAVRASHPDGIDAVAAMHGDAQDTAKLAEQVRSGGHVASAVGSADVDGSAGRGIEGTNVMGRVTTASLELLAGMLERKEITSPEIRSFPFADAGKAFAEVATGHVRGKVVITMV